MLNHFEVMQSKYIKIIESSIRTVDKILAIDKESKIIPAGSLNRIIVCNERNKFYFDKLSKSIIEIAIVGLENSGKSSFANAFIEQKEVFPTDSVRCTFTSTELRYGNDEATVIFFTRKEFNQIFRELLKNIEYSNYENLTFDTLSIAHFTEYFISLEHVNSALYSYHKGKSEQDIIDIINGRGEIANLLDSVDKTFNADQINSGELRIFITDRYKSRSVKNVSITSNKLKDMKDIVIYDVPGFDSTTKKHEEETIKKLKSADAIVLIKNVDDKANVTGTELNTLQKESDEDGVKLSKKLFVFGNKIDKANTRDIALKNCEALKSDLVAKGLATNDKIFVGSAMAYMQSIGKEDGDFAIQGLKKLGFQDGLNAVGDLRTAIREFYKTEAFENLQFKINMNITRLKQVFNEIIKENSDFSNLDSLNVLSYKILIDLVTESKKNIKEKLSGLRDCMIKEFSENKYFTARLNADIDNEFLPIESDYIEKIRLRAGITATGEFPATKVNSIAREILHKEFRKKFTNIAVCIADKKYQEILSAMTDAFISSFGISKSNPYFDELQNNLKNLILHLTEKVSYDQKSFVHLIERFSSDIFDILILYPFGSIDRINKFKTSEKDFYSLSMYYETPQVENTPLFIQPMIEMILGHRKLSQHSADEISDFILKSLKDTKFGQYNVTHQDIEEIINIIQRNNIQLEYVNRFIKEIINIHPPSDFNVARVFIVKQLTKLVKDFALERFFNKEDYIKSLTDNIKLSADEKEILHEINTDIQLLTDILKNSVLNAISLEKPFQSTVNEQINTLIDISDSEEFKKFLSKNAIKIKYFEFAETEEQKAILENKKRIIDEIQKILAEMEG